MARTITDRIKSKMAAHPILRSGAKRGYDFCRRLATSYRTQESDLLNDLARRVPHVFFLQIGAHDGRTDDHLHEFVCRFGWQGILLEPVRSVFDQLIANYSAVNGLTFENKALAAQDGIRTFYRVRESESLPRWCSQLGTFRREVLLGHAHWIDQIEQHLAEEPVECISFATLVQRHSVNKLDLIVIDAEGYDLEILRRIDFRRFRPELVIYEQRHLSSVEKRDAINLLVANDYTVRRVGIGWNCAASLMARRSPALGSDCDVSKAREASGETWLRKSQ